MLDDFILSLGEDWRETADESKFTLNLLSLFRFALDSVQRGRAKRNNAA
jgi:hypothetical protein